MIIYQFSCTIVTLQAGLSTLQIDDERPESLFATLFGMFWDENVVDPHAGSIEFIKRVTCLQTRRK